MQYVMLQEFQCGQRVGKQSHALLSAEDLSSPLPPGKERDRAPSGGLRAPLQLFRSLVDEWGQVGCPSDRLTLR